MVSEAISGLGHLDFTSTMPRGPGIVFTKIETDSYRLNTNLSSAIGRRAVSSMISWRRQHRDHRVDGSLLSRVQETCYRISKWACGC